MSTTIGYVSREGSYRDPNLPLLIILQGRITLGFRLQEIERDLGRRVQRTPKRSCKSLWGRGKVVQTYRDKKTGVECRVTKVLYEQKSYEDTANGISVQWT